MEMMRQCKIIKPLPLHLFSAHKRDPYCGLTGTETGINWEWGFAPRPCCVALSIEEVDRFMGEGILYDGEKF